MNTNFITKLLDWVLGTEPKQRVRLTQCAMAILLVVGSAIDMQYLAWAGLAPSDLVHLWSAGLIGGFLFIFWFVRSGRNRSFSDPSLTVLQMLFAIISAAVGYALAGRGRAGVLPILMVTFMFSMYSLSPTVVQRIGYFSVALFGATMALMASLNPTVFEPAVEIGHFIIIIITVPIISALAGQLSLLRKRLKTQKRDLSIALARIQDLATRDELTGLINHRHMLELIEQERQRGVRSGQVFCIAMLDLDGFKQVNEKHGEPFGDELLRRFAREAMNVIRISDLLCRWNGEAFLLMLSDTRSSLARLGLERLRERIHSMHIESSGVTIQTTFSAGVTEHRAGESVEQTIDRAAQALHSAKAAGRNRVVLN